MCTCRQGADTCAVVLRQRNAQVSNGVRGSFMVLLYGALAVTVTFLEDYSK